MVSGPRKKARLGAGRLLLYLGEEGEEPEGRAGPWARRDSKEVGSPASGTEEQGKGRMTGWPT